MNFKIANKTISTKKLVRTATILGAFFIVFFVFCAYQVYTPANANSNEKITYVVQKGMGDDEIARDLKDLGIIKSSYFFRLYVVASLRHSSLQAGEYELSPKMSIYNIVQMMSKGMVARKNVVIYEGWNERDIGKLLEQRGFCKKGEFENIIKEDFSNDYAFLADKPKDVDLEGYLFPDTYDIPHSKTCEEIVRMMLENFDKKVTPEIREEAKKHNKSLFEIITMASVIEKEVGASADKKIVSGIFWKRLAIGMPLQSCATVNYVTGKSDAGATIKDTQIDSPYNTYKYPGLPKGPISSPGLASIQAALEPTKTPYLYFMSNGKTIYSKTLAEHEAAVAKYLR